MRNDETDDPARVCECEDGGEWVFVRESGGYCLYRCLICREEEVE
jgi:hypothetical protein